MNTTDWATTLFRRSRFAAGLLALNLTTWVSTKNVLDYQNVLLFQNWLKKFMMLRYVVEEWKWSRLARLWTSLMNVYTFYIQLGKSKLRWIPHLLSANQKHKRARMFNDNLKFFDINPWDFLRDFVTVGEIYLHYYILESKHLCEYWRQKTKLSTEHITLPFWAKSKLKVPAMVQKEVLFHHDNAPSHISRIERNWMGHNLTS